MRIFVLAAGQGSRIAPYESRPKTLLPVANRPVLHRILDAARSIEAERVTVAAGRHGNDIRSAAATWTMRGEASPAEVPVDVVDAGSADGTAMTLASVLPDDGPAIVLYGDVVLEAADLRALAGDQAATSGSGVPREALTLLVAPLSPGESRDTIAASVSNREVTALVGHARDGVTHRIVGFSLPRGFRTWIERCPSRFPNVQVGMMPPLEYHLEAAVELYRQAGNRVRAVEAVSPAHDLDKPWHILDANEWAVHHECAAVQGGVRLGPGSRIAESVTVRGNLIVGENTVIETGAIINGDAVIGDNCFVGNGCFIEDGSVIGDECVVSHAAELDGVIFRGVYLYHFMEIYGIVGERTDIGAGTVCGSLRFDDGATVHRIHGRRELPRSYSNATFIGDYCRTGVNATIMPGRKIGPYSIVGPGVVLEEDVPPRSGVRVKQEIERFAWGPERYGW